MSFLNLNKTIFLRGNKIKVFLRCETSTQSFLKYCETIKLTGILTTSNLLYPGFLSLGHESILPLLDLFNHLFISTQLFKLMPRNISAPRAREAKGYLIFKLF